MHKWLVTLIIVLVVAGLAWPWLAKRGLGRLPGDIMVKRGESNFYFPITSSIILSAVITVILWLLKI